MTQKSEEKWTSIENAWLGNCVSFLTTARCATRCTGGSLISYHAIGSRKNKRGRKYSLLCMIKGAHECVQLILHRRCVRILWTEVKSLCDVRSLTNERQVFPICRAKRIHGISTFWDCNVCFRSEIKPSSPEQTAKTQDKLCKVIRRAIRRCLQRVIS